MSTQTRTFSTKYGIDVANTIIVSNTSGVINLSNIQAANVVTINATNFLTSAGLDVVGQANSAYAQANSAYTKANAAANTVATFANGTLVLAAGNVNFNNTATVNVAAAANGSGQSNISFTVNVSSTDWASGANGAAQTTFSTINTTFGTTNTSITNLGSAVTNANAAISAANSAISALNSASSTHNTTFGTMNTTFGSVNTAIGVAYGQANAAYAATNTKLPLTGGTISGSLNVSTDLTVTGNLSVLGNTTQINTVSLLVTDNSIFLASNTTGAPVVNADITVVRGSSPNVALLWNETVGKWGYVEGTGVFTAFDTIYAQANTGGSSANSAANTVAVYANGTLVLAAGNVNFNNTASINVSAVANGTSQSNVSFSMNTTSITSVGTLTGLTSANVNVTSSLNVATLSVNVNTVTLTSVSQAVLDIFPVAAFASAKYFVQANSGVKYHTTEMIVVQDGTNAYITEYGTIQTAESLGTFTATVAGGNMSLQFTPSSANSTQVRSVRYGIAP